jgi:putative DNA primase/helicase
MGAPASIGTDLGSAREFAVLRSIGGIVDGDHPIMNGEPQGLATHDDKPGERAIFYVAHDDGVPNG